MRRLLATLVILSGCLPCFAQTIKIDPYTLPPVKAACGPEEPIPPPAAQQPTPPPLAPGKARIYILGARLRFFKSVRLGADGSWFSAIGPSNFSTIDVAPGIHHLCAATKGHFILPHTTLAVVLARVATESGKTYYFISGRIFPGGFTLTPANADQASMYLQALHSPGTTSSPPKLSKTPAVLADCGPDPRKPIADPPPLPSLLAAPDPGKALVYFFTDIVPPPGLFSIGSPESVQIGMDGQWLGATLGSSYLAAYIAPGEHHLCSADKVFLGVKPSIQLHTVNFAAGHTYYLNSQTLDPADPDRVAFWLAKIAAMPASISQRRDVLNGYSRKESDFLAARLHAGGIPGRHPTEPRPVPDASAGDPAKPPQIILILKSKYVKIDIGLDGRWAGSMQRKGWLAIPTTSGDHHLYIHIRLRGLAPGYSTAVFHLDSSAAVNSYFATTVLGGGDNGPPIAFTVPLDPDEGALLTAFYPSANHPPP